MAAQARHYEKSITYSSRQVDDKYISKNRHNSHLKNSSCESSPYRGGSKTSSHSSPGGGRKRPYNSPNSSKLSNSPYESIRKKDRIDNDMGKNDCENSIDARCEEDETGMKRSHCHRCPINGYIKDDNEWSQHLSSSGKIYYYNRRTEESQWEVPKGWNDRDQESKESGQKERSARESLNFGKESNSREDFREVRDPRGETKDYKYKEKTNSKDYRVQDSRSFRDSRKNREKDSREFWDNFKERDYRERDSRDYDGKHRVTPGSSKRENVKYSSPGIRTVGQSTPGSTAHSRSFRRPTPDSLNGSESVQDISPPGTPTNDDIVNISTISPAPLYTPHSCSPHISTTLTTSRLPLPTTPHTPLLSPILLTSTGHLSTSYLHPLQQALLLQQQQATTNKDTFGSPKLPTVKNHIVHPGGTTPTSPMTSASQKPVPMVHSPDISNRNATPPPPPPPLKDHNRVTTEPKDRNNTKQERQTMQTPTSESRLEQHEILNRSKTHEYQPGDTPVKTTYKTFNSERLIKKTIKLEKEESIAFSPLPDLNKYTEHFVPSVADLNTSFYCNSLENQIAASWEETMTMLHSDGYRSKFNLSLSRQHVDSQDSKLDVSSGWVDALNAVISKVESLQDSSMKSEARGTPRENKSPAIRKNKTETNIETTNENGEKNDMKESILNTNTKEKINTTNSTKETVPNTSPLIVDNEDVLNDIEEMIEKNSR